MLTRYKGQLKLKDWAFAINDAKGPRRSGSSPRNHHARDVAERNRVRTSLGGFGPSVRTGGRIELRKERRPREGADDGADCVAAANSWPTAPSTEPP